MQEVWSGFLERIRRPPFLSENNHRSLPDRGKHGEGAEQPPLYDTAS